MELKEFTGKLRNDLTGQKFGRLEIIGVAGTTGPGRIYYKCLCECGNFINVRSCGLKGGGTRSCGCLTKELNKTRAVKHGKRYSKEYATWNRIKNRCYNSDSPDYKYYGGRGISVCDRWLNSFENFYKDMGKRPENYSIDRVDNNGNYSPENCRWADMKTQNRNKRNNVFIDALGFKLCLSDWAFKIGISQQHISYLHKTLSDTELINFIYKNYKGDEHVRQNK